MGYIIIHMRNDRPGSIIWNDRRNGMFQQLLVMPFSKIQYVISSLVGLLLDWPALHLLY
jgi:hypothetical protein